MTRPIDRLPYADNAYIEGALSAGDGARPASVAPTRRPAIASGPCPLCHRERRPPGKLSAEELDALQFRFWSADHRRFDHLGFARAVIAACAA